MRDDMSKVLVESPRLGRAFAHAIVGSRRLERNRLDADGEGGPMRVGIKQRGNKHFGEHLGPLYRWLRSQVDRPWANVYGELCAQLDRRNVVQNHLFQHIGDRVAVETVWHEGAVWVRGWRGLEPISEWRTPMFVHPRTGILLVNRHRVTKAQRRRDDAADRNAEANAERRIGLPGMAPNVQWHRIDGIWYAIELAPLVERTPVYDIVLERKVDGRNQHLLRERYGGDGRAFAARKRQLGHDTLRAYRLENRRE